jgi:hypothetical protein
MGATGSGIEAADQTSAEALLSAFKTISPSERRKHASVLNYWLSIRGDKEFPPLHDLDPLELSDAGPTSILFELITGGHDAEVRHFGDALKDEGKVERIIDAPHPSLLSSIAKKLPIVAISRDFLAFEDEYAGENGDTRCWVTLLPLSAGGAWVDYVYALVSLESEGGKARKKGDPKKATAEDVAEVAIDEPAVVEIEQAVAETTAEQAAGGEIADQPDQETAEETLGEMGADELEQEIAGPTAEEPVAATPDEPSADLEPIPEFLQAAPEDEESSAKSRPGFSKLFDNLVGLTGFYGHGYKVDADGSETDAADATPEIEASHTPEEEAVTAQPTAEPADEPVAQENVAEPVEEPAVQAPVAEIPGEQPIVEHAVESAPAPEGSLQHKLADVRAKADEAQQAKLRANAALYEGLSAAYDFALDAEDAPEDYLKLVEAQGLKIQLRSPMKPVVKLAFADTCDDATIRQLEAVLSWALDNELPRGSLLDRIEAAGGIGSVLSGEAKAA